MSTLLSSAALRVTARYDALWADQSFVALAPISDRDSSSIASSFIAYEARLLDQRRWSDWIELWAPEGLLWVPVDGAVHPGSDQAFFLDDARRLGERVGRFTDPSAWSSIPPTTTTRVVGQVEAWRAPEADNGVLIARVGSTLHIQRAERRTELALATTYRLHVGANGDLAIVHKIINVPALHIGVTDLSCLL